MPNAPLYALSVTHVYWGSSVGTGLGSGLGRLAAGHCLRTFDCTTRSAPHTLLSHPRPQGPIAFRATFVSWLRLSTHFTARENMCPSRHATSSTTTRMQIHGGRHLSLLQCSSMSSWRLPPRWQQQQPAQGSPAATIVAAVL